MKLLALYAYFMSPFWNLKASANLRKKFKVKRADEIAKKIEEFKVQKLSFEKMEKKQEAAVYENYINALHWALNGN